MNRITYEAAKQEAARRGMTLAGLVESALASVGVPVAVHSQQTPELAQANAARRAQSVAGRREPGPSRERQVLGDKIADACGFA